MWQRLMRHESGIIGTHLGDAPRCGAREHPQHPQHQQHQQQASRRHSQISVIWAFWG